MCGIAAIVARNGIKPPPDLIDRMTALLAHRGPDGQGKFTEGGVALGFRRLAIFDRSPSGDQPMLSHDGRFVIVFNGAIYNFVELREQLLALGHTFRSTGDTEVLLAAYRQWGRECLDRLNGMWAFLIYDRHARRIFGARDRFGIKPLYVCQSPCGLLFASEIKAIRDSGAVKLAVDQQTVAHYLLDGRLDDSERTFYENVKQVEAGTAFEVDESGMKSWRYWSLPEPADEPVDPVGAFRDLFDDAVRLRMRSDVLVGVQLSGGLDSTSIVSHMVRHWTAAGREPQDLLAFSFMSPEYDETEQISATLQQTSVSQVKLESTATDLWSVLDRHMWHHDEPVHSMTSLVGFKLMELTRNNGVTVILNGQGADEVLGGYLNYFQDYWNHLVGSFRWRTAWRDIKASSHVHNFGSAPGIAAGLLTRRLKQALGGVPGYAPMRQMRRRVELGLEDWITDDVKGCWKTPAHADPTNLDESLRTSVTASPLPLHLRVEDRNSMAHGIEVRLPFLDYRLVSLAFRLGPRWKLRSPFTKFILREAMRDRIPEVVRGRLTKFGFPTPVESWFRGPLYEPLRDMLSSGIVRDSGLWNTHAVATALERHKEGAMGCGSRLFDVAQLCLWLDGTRTWSGRMRSA